MKIKATHKVKIYVSDVNVANEICDYLNEHYSDYEWDAWTNFEHKSYVEGSKSCKGWYEPPVFYTKNGDGSPEELELEETIYCDDLKEELAQRFNEDCKVIEDIEWQEIYEILQ